MELGRQRGTPGDITFLARSGRVAWVHAGGAVMTNFSLEALGRWQEQGPLRMLLLGRGAVCSLEIPLSDSHTGSDRGS